MPSIRTASGAGDKRCLFCFTTGSTPSKPDARFRQLKPRLRGSRFNATNVLTPMLLPHITFRTSVSRLGGGNGYCSKLQQEGIFTEHGLESRQTTLAPSRRNRLPSRCTRKSGKQPEPQGNAPDGLIRRRAAANGVVALRVFLRALDQRTTVTPPDLRLPAIGGKRRQLLIEKRIPRLPRQNALFTFLQGQGQDPVALQNQGRAEEFD